MATRISGQNPSRPKSGLGFFDDALIGRSQPVGSLAGGPLGAALSVGVYVTFSQETPEQMYVFSKWSGWRLLILLLLNCIVVWARVFGCPMSSTGTRWKP